MQNESIKIYGFWAIEEPFKALDYFQGRENVLRAYGFNASVKSDFSWSKDDKVFILAAYWQGEIIAGMKVHLKSENPLPVEISLKDKCNDLSKILNETSGGEYAEIGGVWNSKKFAGLSFPHVLARYSLALCKYLGLSTVFTFNASYTYKLSKNYGAELLDSIGNNGWFDYPTPKYKAAIWVFKNVQELNCLYPEDRERIEELSKNPSLKQLREKEIPNHKINYYATI